jgi:DNA-directed RNA polymerase subunit RPC12/RpoP/multisubunit Na+/H+ antiporter MnhG subunit
MIFKCRKCKSEFSLERDAAEIYCPYCGYLEKSEDRNTFYEQVKVVKPIITKKEFIVSQLEKMARLEETPKNVFDNLDYNVKEVYLFYAVRKAKYACSYEATVDFKEKESFTSSQETISKDKDGNRVKTTKPFIDTRTVTRSKIINDFIKFEDSIVMNYKGASKRDLDIISNYKNTFEIDNDVEVPLSVIKNFLNYKKENEHQFDERCKDRLDTVVKEKIIDRHNSYDKCMNIKLDNKEVELGEYDIYCVLKYIWEYNCSSVKYTLENLSCLKHVYGEYPQDIKFHELVDSKKEEIDNEAKKVLDSIYATLGVGFLILAIILYFLITAKDTTTDEKTMFSVFVIVVYLVFAIPIAIIGSFKNKRILKKKEKVETQLKEEKQERKEILCNKQIQKVTDENFKL